MFFNHDFEIIFLKSCFYDHVFFLVEWWMWLKGRNWSPRNGLVLCNGFKLILQFFSFLPKTLQKFQKIYKTKNTIKSFLFCEIHSNSLLPHFFEAKKIWSFIFYQTKIVFFYKLKQTKILNFIYLNDLFFLVIFLNKNIKIIWVVFSWQGNFGKNIPFLIKIWIFEQNFDF